MQYVLLRSSDISKSEYDFFEKPLVFESLSDAEQAQKEWFSFLQSYPCNGDAIIAQILV